MTPDQNTQDHGKLKLLPEVQAYLQVLIDSEEEFDMDDVLRDINDMLPTPIAMKTLRKYLRKEYVLRKANFESFTCNLQSTKFYKVVSCRLQVSFSLLASEALVFGL